MFLHGLLNSTPLQDLWLWPSQFGGFQGPITCNDNTIEHRLCLCGGGLTISESNRIQLKRCSRLQLQQSLAHAHYPEWHLKATVCDKMHPWCRRTMCHTTTQQLQPGLCLKPHPQPPAPSG